MKLVFIKKSILIRFIQKPFLIKLRCLAYIFQKISSVEEVKKFVDHLRIRGFISSRLLFNLLKIRDDVVKVGPSLWLVDQAIIDYFTQVVVALRRHFECFFVVANHACNLMN